MRLCQTGRGGPSVDYGEGTHELSAGSQIGEQVTRQTPTRSRPRQSDSNLIQSTTPKRGTSELQQEAGTPVQLVFVKVVFEVLARVLHAFLVYGQEIRGECGLLLAEQGEYVAVAFRPRSVHRAAVKCPQ